MRRTKKVHSKSRIKRFYQEPQKYGRNRIMEDEGKSNLQETEDRWAKEKQTEEDPEEGGDQS